MSITSQYSNVHRSLQLVARRHGLLPTDIRVLLALSERGSRTTADLLAVDLLANGSQVRRSVIGLRVKGFAVGGGPQGKRSMVELTPDGEEVIRELRDAVTGSSIEDGVDDV